MNTDMHKLGLIAAKYGWMPARHLVGKRTIQYGTPHDVFVASPSATAVTARERKGQGGCRKSSTHQEGVCTR